MAKGQVNRATQKLRRIASDLRWRRVEKNSYRNKRTDKKFSRKAMRRISKLLSNSED